MDRFRNILTGAAMAAPALLIITTVFLFPFLMAVETSFSSQAGYTLDNYRRALRLYGDDILFTLTVSLTALALTMTLALLVGGYLRLYKNNWIAFLFKVPLFVPFVVVGHAMRAFLAPQGLLNALLSQIGLVNLENPPSLAGGITGIVLALTWKNTAYALLLVLSSFQSISDSSLQAAQSLGASYFRQIKDILIPLARSSLFVSGILIFNSLLASFSIPVMMGGGGGPHMLMVIIHYRIIYHFDYGVANALGVISFGFSAFSAVIYMKRVVDVS